MRLNLRLEKIIKVGLLKLKNMSKALVEVKLTTYYSNKNYLNRMAKSIKFIQYNIKIIL